MKLTRILSSISIVILFTLIPVHAQIWLSNKDIYDEAEEYLNAEEYTEALPLYLLLEKKGVFNANIAYKIGECYLNLRGKKNQSVPYLEYAAADASSKYKNNFSETKAPLKAILLLGVAYRISNQLEKSIHAFNIIKDSISNTDPEFLAVIDLHLKRCENARLLNAFPGEPRSERLPDQINTVYSDYNPVLVGHDSILYYMEELKFYDALMRVEYKNGKWLTPENITPAIGSDGDHIIVGASVDGNMLLLYFYEALKAGEIYTTHRTDNGWTKLEPLNNNINTVFHETHASISSDGKTLYFTSNRPGGYGGLDIYKSELDSTNDWGPAVNLGPVINTPYNEESPIINIDDEILYFSSQGHLNMGGYDVFYSLKKGENEWYMPINMGAPISTTDDDLFYYPLEEHVSGLMSRLDHPETLYDIYQYNSMVFANSPRFTIHGKTDKVDTTNYTDYTVAVINSTTSDTVQYIQIGPDGNYEALLPAGDFSLIVLKDEKEVMSSTISLNENSPEISMLTVSSEKNPDTLNIIEVRSDTILLKNILYPFDAYTLSAEYKIFLDNIVKLMKNKPELVFRIEGHTDAIGTEEYNLRLSVKRAKSVADYLVASSIATDRLEIIGMGEENPIARNSNADGSDNPEGRKFNRRVELIPKTKVGGTVFIHQTDIPLQLIIHP
jgi:outer membrane protein OmpA-like peptidoglycan-associated protein